MITKSLNQNLHYIPPQKPYPFIFKGKVKGNYCPSFLKEKVEKKQEYLDRFIFTILNEYEGSIVVLNSKKRIIHANDVFYSNYVDNSNLENKDIDLNKIEINQKVFAKLHLESISEIQNSMIKFNDECHSLKIVPLLNDKTMFVCMINRINKEYTKKSIKLNKEAIYNVGFNSSIDYVFILDKKKNVIQINNIKFQ